jgi:hypothetical protein
VGFRTPHSARAYIHAAALFICQDYKIRCQRRARAHKIALLDETREIDLCSRMAAFFGPVAHLAAQGSKDVDLIVTGPTIRAEVKYFNSAQQFSGPISRDWTWLLSTANTNDEFDRRVWAVFWPSSELFRFTQCLSVPKSHGNNYSHSDYAPFLPFAEPEMPENGVNQRLRFRKPPRTSLIVIGGKKVRVDVVGFHSDPLWCAVYSRVVGESGIKKENHFTADDNAIQLGPPA